MGRSELRKHIFRMIFRIDFYKPEELSEQLQYYCEYLEGLEIKDQVYISDKFKEILEKINEIDDLLNESTTGWKTSRMNKVDLSILRLAVYEVKWDDEVPTGVAINEAVELAKVFSSEEGPAFINGVLAKLVN
ncbi:MAG: transcription antitermination factor NusB [Lachnospiraceae bacterium]